MRYHEMDGILIERVAGADFSDSAILRAPSARPTRSCRPRSSGEEGTGDRRKGYDALRRAQIAHKRGAVGPDGGGLRRTARPTARVQDRTISDGIGWGRTVTGLLLTARFTVRVRAPEPVLNSDRSEYRPGWNGRKGARAHLSGSAPILTQHGYLTSDRVWTPRGVAHQPAQLLSRHLEAGFGSRAVTPAL